VQVTVLVPTAKTDPDAGVQPDDAMPLPCSVMSNDGQDTFAPPTWVCMTVWFAGGVITGALRSIMLPAMGPAVAQLFALSQTCRVSVAA